MRYDYDRFDFLIRQETTNGSETDVIYRMPDFVGNLFETPEKKDRKYGAGGRLLEDPDSFYHYDDEGNLVFREFKELQDNAVPHDRKRMEKERGIRCRATGMGWLYEWASNGMLKKVIRPDGRPVEFRYDALGRRTAKRYFGKVTRWVWDGNMPLHEWSYKTTEIQQDEEESIPPKEPAEDITTWVFEEGTFVPTAKIRGDKQYSIVSDYLGTPIQMYDESGNKVWECSLDIYGKITNFTENFRCDCPFRFQGQYEDEETGLYYNRFRYYNVQTGGYLSQDPIMLRGKNPTLYGYVNNSNYQTDKSGLNSSILNRNLGGFVGDGMQAHHIIPEEVWTKYQGFFDSLGLERDAASNGILLPDSEDKITFNGPQVYHRGSHPQYSSEVENKVYQVFTALDRNQINQTQAKQIIENLQVEYRQKLVIGNVPKNNNRKLH